MNDKYIKQIETTQQLPAGVALDDHNIEFVACKDTKEVIWLQRGNVHQFKHLPEDVYRLLKDEYLSDPKAILTLAKYFPDVTEERRIVEIYAYYMFGDLDKKPDVKSGELQACENFRETENCISLNFSKKNIDINGRPLKRLYINMLDAMAKGLPDKAIAESLGKAPTTFDFHKSKLYKLLGVTSKPEAIAVAFKNNILCVQ